MDNIATDIKENKLLKKDRTLLEILLKDNTTNKNLIWATDTYINKGIGYNPDSHIKVESITGYRGNVIKPRIKKSKREQQMRVKNKAEVFTPSWICNAQNNIIDTAWIGSKDVFNYEIEKGWITNYNKIDFSKKNKDWKEYVTAIRLEIACGEAPYITSRYDTVTGEYIEVLDRIGILDRKLRVVSENNDVESKWMDWAMEAVKSTYGYDYQGDNVLIARENVLYTVIEYFENKFSKKLELENIIELAKIISWNIWQMDGIKFVVPNSCIDEIEMQIDFFENSNARKGCEGCEKNNPYKHTGKYCKIMDWQIGEKVKFIDLMER